MGNKLIHIAPFDIGCSFFDYDYSKKQSRQDFIKSISLKCREKGIIIDETPGDRYMCVAKLNEKITCYLLESELAFLHLRTFCDRHCKTQRYSATVLRAICITGKEQGRRKY